VTGQRSNQLNYVPAMLRVLRAVAELNPDLPKYNQFMTTISRSRKVDNRSSIRRTKSGYRKESAGTPAK
jgi:hypothetical protein